MNFWSGLRKDIGEIEMGDKELRQFGWLVMAVCFIFIALSIFSGEVNYLFLLVFALAGIITNWRHCWWKWPLLIWMALSLVLGALISFVILNLIFWFLLTPIGIISHFIRGDFLKTCFGGNEESLSYWLPRDEVASSDPTKMF